MAKIITENFRVETATEFHNSFRNRNDGVADEFRDSLELYNDDNSLGLSNTDLTEIESLVDIALEDVNPENQYYLFASTVLDSENTIANTQKEKREFLRRVIFGNRIITDNIKYIFTNNTWLSGTSYDSFDDTSDIESLNMFASVLDGDEGEGPYKVFKCIRNNSGAASTVEPSTANLDVNNETTLSDGYVWKYMFDVPAGEYTEYATSTGLPYIANTSVINSATESISDIILESAVVSQFSDYIVGSVNSSTNSIDPTTIASIEVDDPTENTYAITVRVAPGSTPRFTAGSYTGMYFRIVDPGQADAVYDILNSVVPEGVTNEVVIYVASDINLTSTSPTLVNKACDIVPKIEVSKSSGTRCIAYGELDAEGTLVYVQFVNKGTEYKYATANLSLPSAIQGGAENTVLRAVVSPTGGHGYDPISEMYMSRVSLVSNFFTSNLTSIPDTNTYTKVGLVKNPSFFNGTFPSDVDNRLVVTANTDLTSSVLQNNFLEQEVGGETITALIHEVTYNSNTDITSIYLAEYDGAFAGTFEPGNALAKPDLNDTESEPVTINTVSDKQYLAFTGDLLHFIDFDAIERQTDRKEKIKFVFDF